MQRFTRRALLALVLLALPVHSGAADLVRAEAYDPTDGSSFIAGRAGTGRLVPGKIALGQRAFLEKVSATGEILWRQEGAPGAMGGCATGDCELFFQLPGLESGHIVASSLEALALDNATGEIVATGRLLLAWTSQRCPGRVDLGHAAFVLHLDSEGRFLRGAYFGPPITEPPPPQLPDCEQVCDEFFFSYLGDGSFLLTADDKTQVEGWLAYAPTAMSTSWDSELFQLRRDSIDQCPNTGNTRDSLKLLAVEDLSDNPLNAALIAHNDELNQTDGEYLELPAGSRIRLIFDGTPLHELDYAATLSLTFDVPSFLYPELSIETVENVIWPVFTMAGSANLTKKLSYTIDSWGRFLLPSDDGESYLIHIYLSVGEATAPGTCIRSVRSSVAMDSFKIKPKPKPSSTSP